MSHPADPDVDPRILEALGDPVRQRIVTELSESPAGARGLAAQLGLPVATVRGELEVLVRCDAIEAVDGLDVPGDDRRYRAMLRPFLDDLHWRALPPERRQGLFDLTLSDIGERVAEARAVAGFGHVQTHVSLTRLMLDEQGWQELSDVLAGVLEEAMEIEADCADRQARGAPEPLHGSNLAILHFGRAERRAPGREA
jgi:DNA-binding transcriptional ArsR family regulator